MGVTKATITLGNRGGSITLGPKGGRARGVQACALLKRILAGEDTGLPLPDGWQPGSPRFRTSEPEPASEPAPEPRRRYGLGGPLPALRKTR